jgi:endonuclease/exonuclease/phosphatase family metal-dependent hydrolase
VILAAHYKSPGHSRNAGDIIELLRFRHKSLLAGDLNPKHPFWNIVVFKTSGAKLLDLLDINQFDISTPHCPTHYSPAVNGEVLDMVVHKNIRLSEVTVSDILDSDHLPIVSQLLDHVKTRDLSGQVDKFTDWERFQSLSFELI